VEFWNRSLVATIHIICFGEQLASIDKRVGHFCKQQFII